MKVLNENLQGINLNKNERKVLDYLKELCIQAYDFSVDLNIPEMNQFLGFSKMTGYNVINRLEEKGILKAKGSNISLSVQLFEFESVGKKTTTLLEEDELFQVKRALENLECDRMLGDLWTDEEIINYCKIIKEKGCLLNHPNLLQMKEKIERYYSSYFARL